MKRNDFFLEPGTKVVIVFDNSTWRNRLTDEITPPKRSWRKEHIIEWLRCHNVPLRAKTTKAELMELEFSNLSEKR